jgi:hypothetical protein
MTRGVVRIAVLVTLIAAIHAGQAVAMNIKSRIPDEGFVFGAVFVKAAAESHFKLAYDFDRLRRPPDITSRLVANSQAKFRLVP